MPSDEGIFIFPIVLRMSGVLARRAAYRTLL